MKSEKNQFLADNIQYLIGLRGLKQKDFGKIIGVSTATVNNYVNSKSEPSADKMLLIAKEFSISVDQLIGVKLSSINLNEAYKPGDNDDLIIELLMKEVKHLRKQITEQGGDEKAADEAVDAAINTLRNGDKKKEK